MHEDDHRHEKVREHQRRGEMATGEGSDRRMSSGAECKGKTDNTREEGADERPCGVGGRRDRETDAMGTDRIHGLAGAARRVSMAMIRSAHDWRVADDPEYAEDDDETDDEWDVDEETAGNRNGDGEGSEGGGSIGHGEGRG